MSTLIINNFAGRLTNYDNGDINSGFAKYNTTHGNNPISHPGKLTWFEKPVAVLTLTGNDGQLVAMRQRYDSSFDFSYVYGIAKNKNLYKIKADSDTPSVIGAFPEDISTGIGGDMVFYGSSEKIFFSDAEKIQKINFDGSGGASIVGTSSITSTVPHPLVKFIGKIYYGNGNNIGEIDSTEIITTGSKLFPALPSDVYVRDLDVSSDGNYMIITASRTASPYSRSASDSFKYLWNGIDNGATAANALEGTNLVANDVFVDRNFNLGHDTISAGVYLNSQKIFTLPQVKLGLNTSTCFTGNVFGFLAQEYDLDAGRMKAAIFNYGQYDEQFPNGLYRPLRLTPEVREEIVGVQGIVNTNNLFYQPSILGYIDNIGRPSRIYFSTTEASDAVTTNNLSKLWRFSLNPTGSGEFATSVLGGVYETQTQLFSKKTAVKEVRIYGEPWINDNSFRIGLIGSSGASIAGTSKLFETGNTSTLTIGDDVVSYNPAMKPTYALGVQITNVGVSNFTISKIEIDTEKAGE